MSETQTASRNTGDANSWGDRVATHLSATVSVSASFWAGAAASAEATVVAAARARHRGRSATDPGADNRCVRMLRKLGAAAGEAAQVAGAATKDIACLLRAHGDCSPLLASGARPIRRSWRSRR